MANLLPGQPPVGGPALMNGVANQMSPPPVHPGVEADVKYMMAKNPDSDEAALRAYHTQRYKNDPNAAPLGSDGPAVDPMAHFQKPAPAPAPQNDMIPNLKPPLAPNEGLKSMVAEQMGKRRGE